MTRACPAPPLPLPVVPGGGGGSSFGTFPNAPHSRLKAPVSASNTITRLFAYPSATKSSFVLAKTNVSAGWATTLEESRRRRHRVASDGLGGYSGGAGVEEKRWLLILEGSLPPTLDWQPMAQQA